MVELAAVIGRQWEKMRLTLTEHAREILEKLPTIDEKILALVKYVLDESSMEIHGFPDRQFLTVGDLKQEMSTLELRAIMLAPRLALRALDLLHLAACKLISETYSTIDFFVTTDKLILGRKDTVAEEMKITVAELTDKQILER